MRVFTCSNSVTKCVISRAVILDGALSSTVVSRPCLPLRNSVVVQWYLTCSDAMNDVAPFASASRVRGARNDALGGGDMASSSRRLRTCLRAEGVAFQHDGAVASPG